MLTMFDCINDQSTTYTRILDRRQETFTRLGSLDLPRVRTILVLATGSSWNAFTMAQDYVQHVADAACTVVEPYTYVHYGVAQRQFDLIVAVSQRGRSSATFAAVGKARSEFAAPVVALTAEPDSPIGELADLAIDIGCGDEAIRFSTVGVTATTLTAMVLALELAARPGGPGRPAPDLDLAGLRAAVLPTADTIAKANLFYDTFAAELDAARRIFVTGYGPNYGTAREAETKIVETVRIPCAGEELEAFMHGPIFEVHPDYTVLCTDVPHTPSSARTTQLMQFLRRHCEHVFGVSLGAASDQHTLGLGLDLPELLSPLQLVLCYQVFAHRMSAARGHDLTQPVFPDFRSFLGTKVGEK